jgi:hypothetical protein
MTFLGIVVNPDTGGPVVAMASACMFHADAVVNALMWVEPPDVYPVAHRQALLSDLGGDVWEFVAA